ncbi:glutamate carboxypeptidase [Curtobacterium sp. PhB130]|uniref:M20/M25/M40 family metallo-hydrolase n=1 Tax=Curtobacterium sp. PhB130 TaxID=2485178 RepID=UPI000FA9F461|nr:M20/M25/M40 family metallo-hydrolase [Curtobacterium sp. PhB130]ROS74075.1 glutamate carboxypeptidase [Curtobacterium sp. PhB130]
MTGTTVHSPLLDAAESRRARMVDDLVAYVETETPSDDLVLLRAGLAHVERFLAETVGPFTERTLHEPERHGPVVVGDLAAPRPTDSWVVVLCHYDTVWAAGTLEGWPVRIDGSRLTGPGAYDMKAGLVQFAHAVALLDSLDLDRPNIRLVLNGDEEVGSVGSRPVIEDVVRRTPGPVLVFEASAGADGALKTARKGVGLFDVDIRGVEVHAGLDPAGGASAVDELARVVLALHGAADHSAGTSLNVGVVTGGTRPNVRAGAATAALDVRVSSDSEAARIDDVLAGLVPAASAASITVTGGWNRPVMARTDRNVELFRTAEAAAAAIGLVVTETSVGGASDGNFAAALGAAVLDGLGAVGDGAHARHEWVDLDAMVERTALAAEVLRRLA